MDGAVILETKGLNKRFGGLVVTDDLDMQVKRDEITTVIGPNGAGKTTLFNQISGYIPPDSGQILFNGKDIVGKRPFEVCHMGIGRTFQIVKPFGSRTVLYNVMVGAFCRTNRTAEARKISEEIIENLGLGPKRDMVASKLTIADRKRLELAKALATKPQLLLLDEILAGLNPTEVIEAIELIQRVKGSGIAILMIEHVMHAVMALSDKVYVLNYGKKITDGTPTEVSTNPEVMTAYLGDEYIEFQG